ncbi:MAG: sulfotransferase [Cytophagaceae bacterium]|nr:sulfotransferase [Cytophagaceae bacterium]
MSNKIFITGTYRSGSTLLEKLLHAHPDLSVASQPLPSLYFHFKNEFYKQQKLQRPYPINPDFGEEDIYYEDWVKFIGTHKISEKDLQHILRELKSYRGQKSPELFKIEDQISPGTFSEIFSKINNLLGKVYKSQAIKYSGSKEIFCEEFTPFLLSDQCKVIIIVRDPRDIVSSVSFGNAEEYIGNARPILYSLRMWRKSVAYIIKNTLNKNFLFVRYEDLVKDTTDVLDKIFQFLNVPPADIDVVKLLDQNNQFWNGNSSFQKYSDVSISSAGRYRSLLSSSTIRYIESTCFSELKYLGYPISTPRIDRELIKYFKEPFTVNHELIDKNYTHDPGNIALEEERLNALSVDIDSRLQKKYFLFPEVYQTLKNFLAI